MNAQAAKPWQVLERQFPGGMEIDSESDLSMRIANMEAELRNNQREFSKLRDLLIDREKKGRALTDAYKGVLSEMTDLFEAHRNENKKQGESLRFFLASVEARLRSDIRNELERHETHTGWWPVRRRGTRD